MPRPFAPVRRRHPWIGQPPTPEAVTPGRRALAALVVVAAGMGRIPARGAVVQVRPPRPLVTFAPAAVRSVEVWQRTDYRAQRGQVVRVQPPRPLVVFGAAAGRAVGVRARQDDRFRARVQGSVIRSLPSRLDVAVVQERLQPVQVAKQRDARFQRGRVVVTVPPRPLVVFAPATLRAVDVWQRPDSRRQLGRVLFVRPERLAPGRGSRSVQIVRGDPRRSTGRVLFTRPSRVAVVAVNVRVPGVRVVGVDGRYLAGQRRGVVRWTVPPGRTGSAVVVVAQYRTFIGRLGEGANAGGLLGEGTNYQGVLD